MPGNTRFVLMGFLSLSVLLASCAPTTIVPPLKAATSTPAAPSPSAVSPATPILTPTAQADQPRYGGILTKFTSADPPSFDVHQETTLGVMEPLAPAYDGLIQYDRSGKIAGDLAERWEVSSDGLFYTFYLKKSVSWHDGSPFSSADVKYSLDRMKEPPRGVLSVRKEQFDFVDRVDALDSSTIKLVMKQPYVAFLAQLATDGFVIMPKHILETKGHMKNEVLGTGPFRFKNYGSGISIELVKNPDYFMKGLPYLDGITFYIMRDAATRFAAFRTGRVKMTGHWTNLSPSEAATIKAEYPRLSIWRFASLENPRHAINAAKPPFEDVRVRQAVSLAYDRQTAVKVLAEGEAKPGTFLPPGPWSPSPEDIGKLPGYRQPKDADRAEAKKLLADAGYPEGFRMTLLVRAARLDQKVGEFMKDQLATVGISANIEVAEVAVYSSRVREGNFQIGTQKGNFKINDPDEMGRYYLTGAALNYSKWSSERFDDLFAEQSRTLDPARRRAITREMDDILLREVPSLLPFWFEGILATWPEVRNFSAPANLYSSMRLHDVWLAQ
ncbi:MAG: hypothetical protein HYX92_14890 [Chloroflexi bacterium]|nr:hypothetical protein [Chloroflexota bacterium]